MRGRWPVPSPDDVGPNAEKCIERQGLLVVKASKARNRTTAVNWSDKFRLCSRVSLGEKLGVPALFD